jgi:xanthine dehydrogenase YagR molybdenum-binding subunit
MAPYIGGAVSRIDGFAKVTGAAKYAAEFNMTGSRMGASSNQPSLAAGS